MLEHQETERFWSFNHDWRAAQVIAARLSRTKDESIENKETGYEYLLFTYLLFINQSFLNATYTSDQWPNLTLFLLTYVWIKDIQR